MWKTETLISLRGCTDWFEYSLYAHATMYIMLGTGPNDGMAKCLDSKQIHDVWVCFNFTFHFLFLPLIGESARLRDYVNSLGALESVLKLLQGNSSKIVLRRAYWILLNFLAPTEPLLPLDDVQDILPVFCQLLDHNNKTQVRPDYYRP